MNVKKLVSSVAAFAMTASVFAGLAVTASAEETKTTIYKNDFETSSDFTVGGKTDGITYNPATSAANTKNSQIIGRGSAAKGDASLTSPSFSSMETYKDVTIIDVSFDFKIDGTTQGKTSNIALLGAANKDGWLNSNQQILTISATASGNGYQTVKINGDDVTSAINEANGTYENNKLNRDTTGWVTLNARINFATGAVTYSLTKDGKKVVGADADISTAFVNPGVDKLDRIFIAAGKSYGGAYIDNVKLEKVVDNSAVNYDVTFAETNSVATTVTVNGNDATSGISLPNGTYTFKATAEGYFDYEDTFTVNGEAVNVTYTMRKQETAGAVSIEYISGDNVLNTLNADLTDYYAGDKYVYYYPAYVVYDGKYYKANATAFSGEVTLTTEAQKAQIEYTEVTDSTIIAYVEETGMSEEDNDSTGYGINHETNARYSEGNGKSTQGTGSYLYVDIDIPADGNYTFEGPLYNSNSKSRTADFYIDDCSDAAKRLDQSTISANSAGSFSVTADLTKGTHRFIYYTNYSLTPVFDYLVVKQNSVVPTLPKVTVAEGDVYDAAGSTPAKVFTGTFTVGKNNISVKAIDWKVTVGDKVGEATSTFDTVITDIEVVTGLVVEYADAANLTAENVTATCVAAAAPVAE